LHSRHNAAIAVENGLLAQHTEQQLQDLRCFHN